MNITVEVETCCPHCGKSQVVTAAKRKIGAGFKKTEVVCSKCKNNFSIKGKLESRGSRRYCIYLEISGLMIGKKTDDFVTVDFCCPVGGDNLQKSLARKKKGKWRYGPERTFIFCDCGGKLTAWINKIYLRAGIPVCDIGMKIPELEIQRTTCRAQIKRLKHLQDTEGGWLWSPTTPSSL